VQRKKVRTNGLLNLKIHQIGCSEKFSMILDENIQALNSDYEAKRYNNMTLNPLVLNVARKNLFYDWLKQNDKLGGQHKIPRLSNERTYLEQLLQMQYVAQS
jgi:hypothetical protein